MGISFRGGRKNKRAAFRKPKKLHRTNEEITASTLRVVDSAGELVGVISLDQALEKAREEGVDLVEISPKADPPVCRIIDYGKMLYALKKKEQKGKQGTKTQEIKGIRLTFRIGEGDMERQRKKAREFLEEGHPIRIQLVMRGREKAHKDIAFEKLNSFIAGLADISRLENNPKGSGHQIIAILKPGK